MAKRDDYAIIYNPTRWVFKWEVWIHYDNTGVPPDDAFMHHRRSTRIASEFTSEERAKGFVKYQNDIQDFKEKK